MRAIISNLPNKINCERLRAEIAQAFEIPLDDVSVSLFEDGETSEMSSNGDVVTRKIDRHVIIGFANDIPDSSSVESLVLSHSPERTDREEVEFKRQIEFDTESRRLPVVRDLFARIEKLETDSLKRIRSLEDEVATLRTELAKK